MSQCITRLFFLIRRNPKLGIIYLGIQILSFKRCKVSGSQSQLPRSQVKLVYMVSDINASVIFPFPVLLVLEGFCYRMISIFKAKRCKTERMRFVTIISWPAVHLRRLFILFLQFLSLLLVFGICSFA